MLFWLQKNRPFAIILYGFFHFLFCPEQKQIVRRNWQHCNKGVSYYVNGENWTRFYLRY